MNGLVLWHFLFQSCILQHRFERFYLRPSNRMRLFVCLYVWCSRFLLYWLFNRRWVLFWLWFLCVTMNSDLFCLYGSKQYKMKWIVQSTLIIGIDAIPKYITSVWAEFELSHFKWIRSNRTHSNITKTYNCENELIPACVENKSCTKYHLNAVSNENNSLGLVDPTVKHTNCHTRTHTHAPKGCWSFQQSNRRHNQQTRKIY